MILGLSGHLGDRVSALVDGQLSAPEEERAWAHVMGCPGCRRLVEREGWLKTRLGTLSDPTAEARPGLLGSLYDVDAWATVDEIERRGRTRRTAIAAVGAGSVSAAVLGLVAFTGPPAGMGERPPTRQAPASVTSQLAGMGASLGPTTGALRRHAK